MFQGICDVEDDDESPERCPPQSLGQGAPHDGEVSVSSVMIYWKTRERQPNDVHKTIKESTFRKVAGR